MGSNNLFINSTSPVLSLNVATFNVNQNILFFNLMQLNQVRYDLFYNPTPMNIELQQYDDQGNLNTLEIPNIAMLYQNLNPQIASLNDTVSSLQSQIGNVQYLFNAPVASTEFTVTHNLNNMYVDVTCYDQNNNIVVPDNIQALNLNQVQITFDYSIQPIIKVTI